MASPPAMAKAASRRSSSSPSLRAFVRLSSSTIERAMAFMSAGLEASGDDGGCVRGTSMGGEEVGMANFCLFHGDRPSASLLGCPSPRTAVWTLRVASLPPPSPGRVHSQAFRFCPFCFWRLAMLLETSETGGQDGRRSIPGSGVAVCGIKRCQDQAYS